MLFGCEAIEILISFGLLFIYFFINTVPVVHFIIKTLHPYSLNPDREN